MLKSKTSQLIFSISALFILNINTSDAQGLSGYISSYSNSTPQTYGYGFGFYSAIWPLIESPLANFQIGLPSTWIIPNNNDNIDSALCPIGTVARDNWPGWGPTWDGVFQTMEGGPGYWAGNKFHNGSPKFKMNATPNCYNEEVSTPGWRFFWSDAPLPDTVLGIAQLSNRLLIPPDGMTFQGYPNGELLGISYMALPLTNPYMLTLNQTFPVGDFSWTLFLNTQTFKGPLACYLPETWAKISENYSFDYGRGLDSRITKTDLADGTMEINTVPEITGTDTTGNLYTKIPQLQYHVDSLDRTILSQDVTYYNDSALYNSVKSWKNGGPPSSGLFDTSASYRPIVMTYPAVDYTQDNLPIIGINSRATPVVFNGNEFGFQWTSGTSNGMGYFPEYYKDSSGYRVAIDSTMVPAVTGLLNAQFTTPNPNPTAYNATLTGSWGTPGPVLGPYRVILNDQSLVTYYWYRFVDQPVFQQFNWPQTKKDSLQSLIEAMHTSWSITQNYMPDQTSGTLVEFDPMLFVTPPTGYETGYVPIVVRQEKALAPVANFIQQQNLDCGSGFEINFSDGSQNYPSSYQWTFQGGTPSTSNAASETVTFTSPGPHLVTLIATNAAGTDTISQTVTYFGGSNQMTVYITTDNNPEETTFNILSANGDTIYSSFPSDTLLLANHQYAFPFCFADSCYSFSISDEGGNGICCGNGAGHFELIASNQDTLYSGGSFLSSDNFYFCLSSTTGINDLNSVLNLSVSPNPSTGIFRINDYAGRFERELALTDFSGRILQTWKYDHSFTEIDLSSYPPGIYLLKSLKGSTQICKLVKY